MKVFGIQLDSVWEDRIANFEKVERLTKERAAALIAKLGTGMLDRRTMRKLELLRRLASADRSHGT